MNKYTALAVVIILQFVTTSALAYVGPGAGLTAIGSALALIGALILGLIGFFWYPVKRLIRKSRAKES